MAIRALIFDFDGLILDTESPMRESWRETFEEYGLVVSETRWASLLGASADPPEPYDLLEKHLGVPMDRAAIHDRVMSRELQLLESEDVLPGVRELICNVQAAGFSLAVASSSERAWVEGLLTQHDLIGPFDTIVCAEDVDRTKPSPDLFLKALKQLNVEPNEAIVFEDSQHGVKAAIAAGIFCVAVPNKVTQCLPFAEADLVVSSITDYSLQDYVDMATSAPRLRPGPGNPPGTTRQPNNLAICTVRSVDPASATIISCGCSVWPLIDAKSTGKSSSSSLVGMTTLSLGNINFKLN